MASQPSSSSAGLSPLQVSALMEVANNGSGYSAADVGEMLGTPVGISVPRALASSLDDALGMLGPIEQECYAVFIEVSGDLDAMLVALVTPEHGGAICSTVGLEPDTDIGRSLLNEIGNVIACSYAHVLAEMSGLEIEVAPPILRQDMLGALISSVAAEAIAGGDTVLMFDSSLALEGSDASVNVLFIPSGGTVGRLLEAIGL